MTSIRRRAPGDENLFATNRVVKLGSFLSDKQKSKAQTALKNRQYRSKNTAGMKTVRTERKSSIFSSLDKFLDDKDASDDRTTDDTVSLRSSFSSGIASAASTTSYQERSLPPRVEPTLEGENEQQVESEATTDRRRRYQRRGSVTRYSLQDLKEDLQIAEGNDALSTSNHSTSSDRPNPKKKILTKLKSSSHHGESKIQKDQKPKLSRGLPPRGSSVLDSTRSIDDRPIPMRDASIRSMTSRETSRKTLNCDSSVKSISTRPDDDSESNNVDLTVDSIHVPAKFGDSMTSFESFASFDSSTRGEDGDDGAAAGARPHFRRGNNSKRRPSFGSTSSSFDNADGARDSVLVKHSKHKQHLPPRPTTTRSTSGGIKMKTSSLAGLVDLPGTGSPLKATARKDDRSIASLPLPGQGTAGQQQRVHRRGSVTRFSLSEKTASSMNLKTGTAPEDDDSSVSCEMAEGGGRRYQRRGSVTKYSLEGSNHRDDDDNHSVRSEHLSTSRSAQLSPSRSVPGRSSSASSSSRQNLLRPPPVTSSRTKTQSTKRHPKSKSLNGVLSSLPSMMMDTSIRSALSCSARDCEEDNFSVKSEGIHDSDTASGNQRRFNRRGSITNHSLEWSSKTSSGQQRRCAASHASLPQNAAKKPLEVMLSALPLDISTRSAPPSTTSCEEEDSFSIKSEGILPGRGGNSRRYGRRGSITKYSLGR